MAAPGQQQTSVEEVKEGEHPLSISETPPTTQQDGGTTPVPKPRSRSPAPKSPVPTPRARAGAIMENRSPKEQQTTGSVVGVSPGETETDSFHLVKNETQCVMNGLKLKLQGHDKPFQCYTYATSPFMTSSVAIDWKIIVTEDVQSQNIRCHELKPDDNLHELLEQFHSFYAKAVVLINTQENYAIAPEFHDALSKSALPVVVLVKTDGEALLRVLDNHDVDGVYAKLDAENTVDAGPLLQVDNIAVETSISKKSKKRSGIEGQKEHGPGFGQRMKKALFGSDKPSVDLKSELKKLMFTADKGPVTISADPGKFTMVMSAFSNYEKQAKGAHADMSEVFKRLRGHLANSFTSDAPFYVLLAYRLHVNHALYDCEDFADFIMSCIDKVESMRPKNLAQVFNSFVDRGDFEIMFDNKEMPDSNKSVFFLLENACLSLCEVSRTVHSKATNVKAHEFVYARMMWVTLALKLHDKRAVVTKSTRRYWQEYFTTPYAPHVAITSVVIKEVKKGIDTGRLLKLPSDLTFGTVQMADLLTTERLVRPFHEIQDFFFTLESNFQFQDDVVTFLTNIRAPYDSWLKESNPEKLKSVSKEGTVVGAIQEGTEFLDVVYGVCIRRKFELQLTKAEMWKWLLLLLQLIDVTGDNPVLHFKKLYPGKTKLLKDLKPSISKYIHSTTRRNFQQLSIQQFYALYKAFLLFSVKDLQDYLEVYSVPPGLRINDATWKEFFALIVVERFSGAHNHHFLLDFLRVIATRYREEQRAGEFVVDLLELGVPKLFGIDEDKDLDEEIAREFSVFLKDYISRNALKNTILTQMAKVMTSISEERDEFQRLVLNVLQREVIPEFKVLKDFDSNAAENFRIVLQVAVAHLCKDLDWLQALTTKQKFCWGIVAACCSKIFVSVESFEWVHSYDKVMAKLGRIYFTYCNGKKLADEEKIITEALPVDIQRNPSPDVKKYFEWVSQIQAFLSSWQKNFGTWDLNYDDILDYASNQTQLNALSLTVCAASLVVDSQHVQEVKTRLLENFEQLNSILLKYIPSHPEAKWCTLPTLLKEYGVTLPSSVQEVVSKHVAFPGDDEKTLAAALLKNPLPPNTTGTFQPGVDISLRLTKSLSIRSLEELVQNIHRFQVSLLTHLDTLVFFKLHHSVMFDTYLRVQIKQISEQSIPAASPMDTLQFSGIPFSISPSSMFPPKLEKKDDEMPKKILQKSLDQVTKLLYKIMDGTATYSEIIAKGELNLEKLDIEKEFAILSHYITSQNLQSSKCKGLSGVKSMLELFKYGMHVRNILNVCEQYKLHGCLEDPRLDELRAVVSDLQSEEDRRKLTPNKAQTKMTQLKELLCLTRNGKETSPKCLELFAVMADSAAFYQFVRDKQFHGKKGHVAFDQQYHLITTQLQHEEYDETVLNHLRAAFTLIGPFMDSKQTFEELMCQVTGLDVTNGLKQLETVNANITLIRLWFSRAEGDTLQNVANELDCILSTGYYIFRFSHESSGSSNAYIMLEYVPSTAVPGQQFTSSSLEETDGTSGGPLPTHPQVFPRMVTRIDSREDTLESDLATMSNCEKWNIEQINDFVRKLGFLDTEKEGGEKIKLFLHISETAYKLLELYIKLRELGHPKYSMEVIPGTSLKCSIQQEAANERVKETEAELTSWTTTVTNLRSQYSWLLFFSVPKLLKLYVLLTGHIHVFSLVLDQIVGEISFLCDNNFSTRKRIRKGIDKTLLECDEVIHSDNPPMYIVGHFLDLLFMDHSLPRRSSESTIQRNRSLTSLSFSRDSSQLLHYCPGYSQEQLIRLIISVYSGVPESFEVFHCRPTTTEEELSLFFKRAAKYPLKYLVLEVNRLPFKLQECLMQLHLLTQQEAHKKKPQQSVESQQSGVVVPPCIHFVETAPSVLREMPWVQLKEHKEPSTTFESAKTTCIKKIVSGDTFACIQLVFGHPGDGKTHYIKQQLNNCDARLTIAVNEAFTPLKAITKLRSLPLNQPNCGIFFNFTMLPPGESVDESERMRYHELMEVIGWFFFDLFILGYVEDPDTGNSFRIPGGLRWAIFIEVPSRDENMQPGEALKQFECDVPSLGLLGTPHYIQPMTPYAVDEDVQLVCKYLRAFNDKGKHGIDKLYREGHPKVKFSTDQNLDEEECQYLLQRHMPNHIKNSKITQKLFVKYMKRRCAFLDNLPAFNYNTGGGEYLVSESGQKEATNTKQLGSTLLNTMLSEVADFCDPDIKENWSVKPHQQLIYDFKDGGASFGLISLHPDKLPDSDKSNFMKIGVKIPSMLDLYKRDLLDKFLSRALNVELDENHHLSIVDDSAYVLTLDYMIKMLNIHERHECGVPVIIEGETGVGKTALVEMLSKLWNQSLLLEWKKLRGRLIDFFQQRLGDIPTDISDNYEACVKAVEAMSAGEHVNEDSLVYLCQLPDGSRGQLHTQLKEYLLPMKDDPVVALLTLRDSQFKHQVTIEQLFEDAQKEDKAESIAHLLYGVLSAQVKGTFHKINVHAAMTPSEIWDEFQPVFHQAEVLQEAFMKNVGKQAQAVAQTSVRRRESKTLSSLMSVSSSSSVESMAETQNNNLRMPFVTVFLDEVNTSSCVGLFKEIIVDRTFDGTPIPDNVFIVAACNPHRGNSLASHESKDRWMRGSYYVRRLHPTLKFLMWDYGSLNEDQERDYINAKMTMLNHSMSRPDVLSLTDLIVKSQNLMRGYAYQQLVTKKSSTASMQAAKISSRSCVSQRDIQRVFTLYRWFSANYTKFKPYGNRRDYHRRAVLVALGIVYYMRLNAKYRQEYQSELDKTKGLPNEVSFSKALQDELTWYISQVELPKGIARTQALKENLFATIVCTVTHTPLIIVGAPGSSKTLSFNQAIANLKGPESKKEHFRNTDIFRSLDPHYYQCSRRTTSNEIQTVFSRAINRQRSHNKFKLPIYCVVFMDEAGLPEESHESLKVLHYHLDKQEVSFVAITNHVLDAAKTNRAISLFRPEASNEDLETLAKGCLCSNPEDPPPNVKKDLDMVVKFCNPYCQLMERSENFAKFFGLRDFIHFVNFLRRKRDQDQVLTPQIVTQALERNFNGSEEFQAICKKFLQAIESTPDQVQTRTILEILSNSLQDRPQAMQDLTENEVRYKLIIDPSEDDSLVRLLFSFEVLKRENTRMYVCSDFPGDGQMQKINTIAAIRHSAIEGHTVVMSQTDDIHESFYDLFNQRFRRIDDPEQGPRYYTTIAIGAHLKPSRVHPNFQCVVVMKKSEVKDTPAPFLNRFEKYLISHRSLLDTAFSRMPVCMAIVIKTAMAKVQEFIDLVSGGSSLYGFKEETLDSLVLTLLPPLGHPYENLGDPSVIDDSLDIKVYLVQELLQALRHSSGFTIPPVAMAELEHEAEHLFDIVLLDPEFDGLMDRLDHNGASQAVIESINMLNTAPPPEDDQQHALSPEGCMVVSLLQQWLIQYFCKKLMQLMTSEALVLHRNKLPYMYLENYLVNQPHFSLKDVVCNYYDTLEGTGWDRTRCPANKVLCFTRSSQLIHLLPAQHPSTVIGTHTNPELLQNLKDYVFDNPNALVICKLSSVLSQSTVQDLLKKFIRSDAANICLLVANMQETSQQIVNHIRIMIEELESQIPHKNGKLFVLLLHFPPAQFFKPCYPSLFLRGWDHCYLDTIAHSAVKGGVDIRDWFCQCCFPGEGSQIFDEDSLLCALQTILPQAIPILSSKVFFGTKENASFNCPMNGSKRSESLQKLLFEKGVGNVLCEKFRAYWKPSVIAEYLEKAAIFSKNRESTLNITETIQSTFKSLFFDFLVCMIYRINENYNLDVLFNEDSTPAIQALFLEVLKVFPTPKLSEVTLFSTNLVSPQPPLYVPQFPFFKLVAGALEKIVDQSHEEANVQMDILGEGGASSITSSIARSYRPHDQSVILANLQKAVKLRIETLMKDPKKDAVVVALEAMSNHPELWDKYFGDFVLHKLKLESPEAGEGIAKDILYVYFSDLHQQESIMRIVGLHSYLHVYHLNYARMAVILRPLNKIQKLHGEEKAKPHLLSPLPSSPTHQLISDIKTTGRPFYTPEYLASFVINTLFNALVGSAYQSKGSVDTMTEKLTMWFKAYRDVMTLPSLKKHVYLAIGSTQMNIIEARLNLMHATFLTLQSKANLDGGVLVKGHKVFQTLYSRHFDEDLELKAKCPRLADVSEVTVEILSTTSLSPDLPQDTETVRILVEGLFAHFFSADRQSYHPNDVRWFMELANEQQQWCAKDLETESGVIAGGLSEDLVHKMEKNLYRHPEKTEVPQGAISMNIFKMYLARVLGRCDQSELSGPLLLYNHESRTQVCDVLLATPDLGSPMPYIPTFYLECSSITLELNSQSALMQQPLAHLYFLSVLEHLMSQKDTSLPSFIRTANTIFDQCKSSTLSDKHQVLLWIEAQAVVQVIIQRLSLHLDPLTPHKIGDVYPIITDVNWLLDDDSMGGGKTGGHGMVLALHLLKLLKSSRKFTDLLVEKYETNLRSINCLKPFHLTLKQKEASEPKPHLFPFILPGAESDGDMATLYQRVKKTMLGIHKRTEIVDALVHIADECVQAVSTSRGLSPGSQSASLIGQTDKRLHFRMMVWLVTYYEFYDQNVSSPFLCNVMGGQEISHYLKEEGYIRLMQCFLNPELMLNRPESANPLEGQAVYHITPDGRTEPIKRKGPQYDPLYKLFMPDDRQKQDQSDKDLRHSLANMVAVVIGSPARSNHLWYHLFATEQLPGTFLTGFMYNKKINREGLLYDCGVELSSDGQFGRQDYQTHAGRGTYTLHSLYLLLWANFGSFCMSLLTQPDSDIKIHGPLISEWLSVRHYCVSQLRAIWLHMRNNLNLSEEERSFFITRSIKRFYELLKTGTIDSLRGIFKTKDELDSYEKMWHCLVYQPSWNELKLKFAQYSQLWQNKLFVELRRLNLSYPHFPTEQDFTHRVLACGNLEQHSEGGELRLLSQFSLDWPKLQAGGLLLPDLVEFYQWLHTQLAHLVTYEKATTWTIGQVMELVTRRYSKEMGGQLRALYERLKFGYNKYVELIGGAIGAGACAAVKQGNRVYTIADDIPLLHFLTDVEQEEQGNDWLYTVIANIVATHNVAIETVYSMLESQKLAPLKRLLPDEPSNVYVSEVDQFNCIVGSFSSLHGVSSFLQMIRSRYQPPLDVTPNTGSFRPHEMSISGTMLQSKPAPSFQLKQLEEDMVTIFFAGKPIIHSPDVLRSLFKFRQTQKSTDTSPAEVVRSALDLDDVAEKLTDAFKAPLEDSLQKRIEYEFHSAGYHPLVEVVTGLRTVVGHLIKELVQNPGKSSGLECLTVPNFLLGVYDHLHDNNEVLKEINIRTLTRSQLTCIIDLPLSSLYNCLMLFVSWVDEGLYDFSSLPFPVKTHLSFEDETEVENLRSKWTGSLVDLLTELKQLTEVLKHSEADIMKNINVSSQKPIIEYLREYHMLGEGDQLPKYIPKTILLHHYVSFRLALRRTHLKLQAEYASESGGDGGEGGGQKWSEVVNDLWHQRLPHLRDVVGGDGGFMFDPTTGHYGFQEDAEYACSEVGLLEELEKDPEDFGYFGEGNQAMPTGDSPEPEDHDVLESFAEVPESESEPQARVTHTYDLADDSSDEEKEFSARVDSHIESRLKKDPSFQKKVLSMLKSESEVLEQSARKYTVQKVVKFLGSLKLDQYAKAFEKEGIEGEVLLEMDSDTLEELGVTSAFDRLRILVLFRRKLKGGKTKHPVSKVLKFLHENDFGKYCDIFEKNRIDGDMLLHAEGTLVKNMLKEVGITSQLDITKIRSKFKTAVTEKSISKEE